MNEHVCLFVLFSVSLVMLTYVISISGQSTCISEASPTVTCFSQLHYVVEKSDVSSVCLFQVEFRYSSHGYYTEPVNSVSSFLFQNILFLLQNLLFLVFQDMVSLCRSSCPGTRSVDWARAQRSSCVCLLSAGISSFLYTKSVFILFRLWNEVH